MLFKKIFLSTRILKFNENNQLLPPPCDRETWRECYGAHTRFWQPKKLPTNLVLPPIPESPIIYQDKYKLTFIDKVKASQYEIGIGFLIGAACIGGLAPGISIIFFNPYVIAGFAALFLILLILGLTLSIKGKLDLSYRI